ncbi:hypothetical protein [Ahrensia kielensis]|uniref:hypothetical protein n=1 Tax=Ahrensia kielensis TaxID=76980 RepID=UPI000375C503|nr:hypothetical protein [Ahrensia kielensis]
MQIVRTIFVLLGGYSIAVFVASICVTSAILTLATFEEAATETLLEATRIYAATLLIVFIMTAVTAIPGFLLSLIAAYALKKDSHLFFTIAGIITAIIVVWLVFGPSPLSDHGPSEAAQPISILWLALIIVSGSVGGFAYALWHRRLFHRA